MSSFHSTGLVIELPRSSISAAQAALTSRHDILYICCKRYYGPPLFQSLRIWFREL